MKKRLLSMVIAICLCLIWLPQGKVNAVMSRDGLWSFDRFDGKILKYYGNEEHLKIPGTIDGWSMQTIGSSAFANNTTLKTVDLGGSIREIGGSAFYGCTNLVSIRGTANFVRLWDRAFMNCTSLERVDFTLAGYKIHYYVLGYSVFENCSSLKEITIPESIWGILDQAFKGCSSLETINLHKSIIEVGAGAFAGCTNLDGIWLEEGNSSFSNDEKGVLFNKDKTEIVSVPGGLKGTYTVPRTVTKLADEAFSGCKQLETVVLHNALKDMGRRCFENCVGLKSFTIPSSISVLETETFKGCTGLESITIPKDVYLIREGVFYGCTGLSEIKVAAGNYRYAEGSNGELLNKDRTELVAVPGAVNGTYQVPATVKTLCRSAFAGCEKLKTVLIPDSVTAVGSKCFENCTALTTVVMSANMAINEGQFRGCTALKTVVIKEVNTHYGKNAFEDCTNLKSIYCLTARTDYPYEFFKNVTANLYYLESKAQLPLEELQKKQFQGKLTWVPLDGYCVAQGNGSKYVVGSDIGAIFLLMADWNKLSAVSVDGQQLSEDQYLSMTQGTAIVLKDAYLKTLPLGEHTLEVIYTDGSCNAAFTLAEPCVHNTVKLPAVAPTCTKTGLTEGSGCSKCGEAFVKQKTVEALGHDYSVTTQAPTCTEGGFDLHRCTRCGKTAQANETAALGHRFGGWQIIKNPTLQEPGTQVRQCENCDKREEKEIAPLEPPVEQPTEPPAEQPTEPPIEQPTEPPSEQPTQPTTGPENTEPTQPVATAPMATEPTPTQPGGKNDAEQANLVPWIIVGSVLLVLTAVGALYLLRKKS